MNIAIQNLYVVINTLLKESVFEVSDHTLLKESILDVVGHTLLKESVYSVFQCIINSALLLQLFFNEHFIRFLFYRVSGKPVGRSFGCFFVGGTMTSAT